MNDLKELKSKAYDLLAAIQNLQNQLVQVNQMIALEMKKPQEKKVEKSHTHSGGEECVAGETELDICQFRDSLNG